MLHFVLVLPLLLPVWEAGEEGRLLVDIGRGKAKGGGATFTLMLVLGEVERGEHGRDNDSEEETRRIRNRWVGEAAP